MRSRHALRLLQVWIILVSFVIVPDVVVRHRDAFIQVPAQERAVEFQLDGLKIFVARQMILSEISLILLLAAELFDSTLLRRAQLLWRNRKAATLGFLRNQRAINQVGDDAFA